MIEPIVNVAEVARLVARGDDVVIADVRWYLDGRSGREAFEAAHIPGAVFVDIDTDLADHTQPATSGRHPFPSAPAFAEAMSKVGIADGTTVIAYDDSGGGTAGRLVWMLRIIGHPAALLDGGLVAWPLPHDSGPSAPRSVRTFTPREWPSERFASADEAAAAAAGGAAVLDARSADRFRGESEAIDRKAGHIPGARSAHWAASIDPTTKRFRDAAALAEHFGVLGARQGTDVVCYCGSGVSACANLLALERAGVTDARLYVPSWSGWSSDPDRPVATGP